MPGFLYQIENRQKEISKVSEPNKPATLSDGPKTIGIKVSPQLYERLAIIKDKYGLKSMKEALVRAASEGVTRL